MNDIQWWWLSYACEQKGFLGAAIILAPEFIAACEIAKGLGISPGGEVLGNAIDPISMRKITLYDTMKLLNKKEAMALVRIIDDESV